VFAKKSARKEQLIGDDGDRQQQQQQQQPAAALKLDVTGAHGAQSRRRVGFSIARGRRQFDGGRDVPPAPGTTRSGRPSAATSFNVAAGQTVGKRNGRFAIVRGR